MQAQEVAFMEAVVFCGDNAAVAELLLMVEHNTLVSGEGVTVARGTLRSSATPTLKAVALEEGLG
jgi:hypothetical protein